MNTQHAVGRLIVAEVKRDWPFYLGGLALSFFMGILASALLNGGNTEDETDKFAIDLTSYVLDFFFLMAVPSLSSASKVYWLPSTLRQDGLTQRLIFLRSLPIPVKQLVFARLLLMAATLVPMLAAYFSAIYLFAVELRELLSPGQFLLFALMWLGYGFLFGGIYPYLEYSTTWKKLVWSSVLIILFVFLLAIVSYVLFPTGLVGWIVTLAQRQSLVFPVLFLVIGVLGVVGWHFALNR